MRFLKTGQCADKSSCSTPIPTNRSKMLSGLLSARTGLFVLFNVLYGFVFAAHFDRLLRFVHEQPHYPHFSLILLVSFYLMYTRWQALSARAAYCVQGGIPIVLVGGLCYLLGLQLESGLNQHDFMALSTSGMVIVWIGGFVTFFGLPAARVASFPLSFLLFIIPLPAVLLSTVTTALQYASAEVASVLFELTPLPVFRDGLVFTLPGLTIEVARECSSIRSSMALLIASVLVSHLFLRRWRSRALILLLVYPLAVFKNGIRIVTLCLLTIYVDRGFITGNLHTRGGAVFFALALVILLALLIGLRKREARRADPGQKSLCAAETS